MFVVGKFETQHITVNACLSFKYEFAIGGCLSVNLSFGLGVVWFWIMQGLTWTLSKMSSSVIEPKILGFFYFNFANLKETALEMLILSLGLIQALIGSEKI